MKNTFTPSPDNTKPRTSPRTIKIQGILMIIVSLALIFYFGSEYIKERARILSLPQTLKPEDSFVDIYRYMLNADYASVFIAMGLMMLVWGTYRIIRQTKADKTTTGIALLIVFFLFIGQYAQVNSANKETTKELLSLQHTWAEQRYGIEYDDITTKTIPQRRGADRQLQDQVILDGKVIATVCPSYPADMIFCEPGTTNELPLIYLKR